MKVYARPRWWARGALVVSMLAIFAMMLLVHFRQEEALHRVEEREHGRGGVEVGRRSDPELRALVEHFDRDFVLILVAALPLLSVLGFSVHLTARQEGISIEALRQSEERYRRLADSMIDVIWRLDVETGRFTYVSPSVERLRGYTATEVLEQPIDAVLTPESRGRVDETLAGAVAALRRGEPSGIVRTLEVEQPCRDGSTVWTETVTTLFEGPGGRLEVQGVSRNITDRKRAEGLVEAQKRVLERIAIGAPLQSTLEELLRVVEQAAPEATAEILMVEREGGQLRHAAGPSLPEAFVRAMDGIAIGPSAGSCGTAAHRREAVYCEDIATDPLWARRFAIPLAYGFRSCYSAPIFDDVQRIVGTLGLYFGVPRGYDGRHKHLLELATQTASICIGQHRVQSALRESEERFRRLAESLPQLVWTSTPRGECDYLSPQWVHYTGIPEAEQLGSRWLEQLHPEDRERALQTWWSTAGMGEVFLCEFRIRRHDGSYRWFDTRAVPFYGPDGEIVKWFGSNTDITERRQAEERLRQSEERFSKAFHTNPAALAILRSVDGAYVDINDAFSAVTGFSRTELIHADDSGAPREGTVQRQPSCGEGLAQVPIHNFEAVWWHRSGERREVLVSVEPIELNHEPCMLTSAVDISERKEAERALKASEERFRSLVEQAADGIFVSDGDGAFLDSNSAGCAMFGYSREELLELAIEDVIVPQEIPRIAAEVVRFAGGKVVRSEWNFRRKDGSKFLGEVMGRRLGDGRVQAILRDVTERREVEEQVRKLNSELEKRVAERTAQLESANRELEAFSYSVSHDLRAPLRAVDGFSQALVEECATSLSDQGLRYLKVIRGETQRMGTLIDDLLAFSRLSRAPVAKKRIDTTLLARSACRDLSALREGRIVEISIPDLSPCSGDPALLKQVWTNLLSNALKYTGRRERAVIDVGCRDGELEVVYFVRDNGAGFDMRYVQKLFGVFQRLHRAEDYEGTGVGLAIVQRIVHRHGGRVWAEAEPDRGATFSFSLPKEIPS